MATITGGHHIALTVTDVERSSQWYCDLLGMQVLFAAEDETVSFKVLGHPGSGWVLGVRQYANRPPDRFDEFRVGLDHFAFTVASMEELRAWESELERRNVRFSPIAESPIGTLVVFRDPDDIQLEFWLPAGS
ncbi:MAG: glyoxylase family protein [Nocardioidaceae bacterium]|jgi:glyoxylase I family protein|nr:glyoxylase family protein [Nocardioidaceae bacterium]